VSYTADLTKKIYTTIRMQAVYITITA